MWYAEVEAVPEDDPMLGKLRDRIKSLDSAIWGEGRDPYPYPGRMVREDAARRGGIYGALLRLHDDFAKHVLAATEDRKSMEFCAEQISILTSRIDALEKAEASADDRMTRLDDELHALQSKLDRATSDSATKLPPDGSWYEVMKTAHDEKWFNVPTDSPTVFTSFVVDPSAVEEEPEPKPHDPTGQLPPFKTVNARIPVRVQGLFTAKGHSDIITGRVLDGSRTIAPNDAVSFRKSEADLIHDKYQLQVWAVPISKIITHISDRKNDA